MPQEVKQLKEEVEVLKKLVSALIKSDNYYFGKHLVLADGANIKCNTGTGSSFGSSTTQKLSVYGETPVVQAGAISAPSGGATQDAEARSAINSIRTALTNFGITA